MIVAYNIEKLAVFRDCLKMTLTQNYNNLEVIVVNNGSVDKTNSILDDYSPDVRILDSSQNLGFAGANNLAYQRSSSDYVLLLNPDAIPEPDSLKEGVTRMENDNRLGALGGIQLDYQKRNITGVGGFFDVIGRAVPVGLGLRASELRQSYLSYIIGSWVLLNRRRVGSVLFPSEFTTFGEDVELGFRLWTKGYRSLMVNSIVCRHERGSTTRSATFVHHRLNRMLSHDWAKNHVLLLTYYKKYAPEYYPFLISSELFRGLGQELLNLPLYALSKERFNRADAYYPGVSLTKLKWSMRPISTMRHWGPYSPLLIRSNLNSFAEKIELFLRQKSMVNGEIIVNDDDLAGSARKFIITK